MPDEKIEDKARRVLGDPIDMKRLLRAIEKGEWTPDDAKALRKANSDAPN